MAIYLDSADLEDARRARGLGWVRGITTNPALLAKAGGDPAAVLAQLNELGFPEFYYQLVSEDTDSMRREAEAARIMIPHGLVLKIAPTLNGFGFVARHGSEFPCCVTAIFNPSQALVAREAGAHSIAVYVNRATRQMGDGPGLVREAARILDGSRTVILAASLKSASEAVEALLAGAAHITAPLGVLLDLHTHPLSVETLRQFALEGTGLTPASQGE